MALIFKNNQVCSSIKELSVKFMKMKQKDKAIILLYAVAHIYYLSNDKDTSEFVDMFINPYRQDKKELKVLHDMLEQGRLYKKEDLDRINHAFPESDTAFFDHMNRHLEAHTMLSVTIGSELTSGLRDSVYRLWEQLLSAHIYLPEAIEKLKLGNEVMSHFSAQKEKLFDDRLTSNVVDDILKRFPFVRCSLNEYLTLCAK